MKQKGVLYYLIQLFSWVFLLFFLVVLGLTIMSNFDFFGGYRSLLVQSGSMEPTIATGDIIIIGPKLSYQKNDVITFEDDKKQITTHRIVDIKEGGGEKIIATKGDANRTIDQAQITPEQIIGKVQLVIPRLGFLVAFARSGPGLVTLILIPVILIILDEIRKMKWSQD